MQKYFKIECEGNPLNFDIFSISGYYGGEGAFKDKTLKIKGNFNEKSFVLPSKIIGVKSFSEITKEEFRSVK